MKRSLIVLLGACLALRAALAMGQSVRDLKELSVDQLHDSHVEFGDAASRGEFERNFYGQVRWSF